ncbi:MAG: type VI secretion system Vgr family protein, partial [Burkholderiales bacterium]
LSEDPAIDGEALLRTPASVTLKVGDGGERAIHGLISRFAQFGRTEQLTTYRAEVVPWLWFLSLSSDCRVFQNLSVLDIAEQVFKDQGYSDFEIRCTKSYAKREYCVQYRETHLNFVSRLLEDEGIFYFFEHADDKHVLVLADSPSAVKACPNQAGARMAATPGPWQEEDVVTAFEREHAVHAGKVTLRDYDYLQPALQLESSVSGDGDREVYDYPGKFAALEEGARYARLQLEEREALRQVVRGESTCRAFRSGYRFDLKEHYRRDANQAYQLLQVWHSARGGDYAAGDVTSCQYSNTFVAIPHSVPFRPPRRAAKPVVQGAQTAVVVGKSGEEIWVDKHGRVKVQFYWDRNGKKDENSSCWVRVATTWGGKNWGFIQIPRIGQEVIIEFLEGDPDRPIITGRVYNADQTPPYALPDNQTQSGVKSRSSKGGSGENFNEIRFEDMKGSEVLFIHAEKDKQVEVENDRTESVGHDEKITIEHDRTESVGNNEAITIGKNRKESVGEDEQIGIGGNRTRSVGKKETIDIGADRNKNVSKNETATIGESRKTQVGKDDTLNVGKKLVLVAGEAVQIQTGDASITMQKNGKITIRGKDIMITGSGKIDVKASSDVTIKGSKIKQN